MKLNQLIAQYVVFRKSLGAKFEGNETVLHTFCRVVGEGRHVGKVRPHEVASFLDGCGPVTRTGTGSTSCCAASSATR